MVFDGYFVSTQNSAEGIMSLTGLSEITKEKNIILSITLWPLGAQRELSLLSFPRHIEMLRFILVLTIGSAPFAASTDPGVRAFCF